MYSNDTNNTNTSRVEPIHKELSYLVTGVLMSAHNELGCYSREKQYGDVVERILKEKVIKYQREVRLGDSNNIADMVVENKIVLELKAKRIITKEDYYQIQRYRQESGLKLGLLANFRDRLIKPKRVVRIDGWKM